MGVQVQSATKNGQGESLSILNRQFISFSYGGKNIEDFDLLAIFSNDRLDKEIYAPFNDTTTEQTELDGQMFWRTNFKANQLSFDLSTDGITSVQLEDFKNWFQPGYERELILSEFHNRAIMARVASTPQISLLPFEKEVQVKIGNNIITTSTSLYKGDIKLSFVMDDPFWYSKESYLKNATITKEDAKLIHEDGVPHVSMFSMSAPCFLAGENWYSNSTISPQAGFNLTYNNEANCFLYYCGTAPEKPLVTFSMTPNRNSTTGKITFPCRTTNSDFYLALGSEETYQTLSFTYPNLISSYNKALDIVSEFGGTSILDLRRELRDTLFNHYARSFAIGIVDYAKNNKKFVTATGEIQNGFKDFFIQQMLAFLPGNITFSINGKTGVVTISTQIQQFTGQLIQNGQTYIPSTSLSITENAGNMLKSNYLTIETRTLPLNGYIGTPQCLLVTTNSELKDLKINYKYKYL